MLDLKPWIETDPGPRGWEIRMMARMGSGIYVPDFIPIHTPEDLYTFTAPKPVNFIIGTRYFIEIVVAICILFMLLLKLFV